MQSWSNRDFERAILIKIINGNSHAAKNAVLDLVLQITKKLDFISSVHSELPKAAMIKVLPTDLWSTQSSKTSFLILIAYCLVNCYSSVLVYKDSNKESPSNYFS